MICCFMVLLYFNSARPDNTDININTVEDPNKIKLVNFLNSETQFRKEFSEEVMSDVFFDLAEHDLTIHFDATSSHFTNQFVHEKNRRKKVLGSRNNMDLEGYLNSVLHSPAVRMINYDVLLEQDMPSKFILERSTIHIVILVNHSMFDSLNKNTLKPNDLILFVCHKHYGACKSAFSDKVGTLNPRFLADSNFLKSVLNILIIEFNENCIRLYNVCFYCGASANALFLEYEEYFHRKTSAFNTALSSEIRRLFYKSNWDFEGHVFKVAYISRGISFACRKPKNISFNDESTTISCEHSLCLEGNMLEEMQKRMNFNYVLLNFEGKYGRDRESLILLVNQSKADIAIGSISVTSTRWKMADFSYRVMIDPCRVVYNVQSTFLKEGLKLIYVFSAITWGVIAIALIAQSIVAYVSNQISDYQISIPFYKILWIVGFFLTDQAQGSLQSAGGRVLILWVLCSIIISTLYKAQLSSFITKPPVEKLLNFDELVREGYDLNVVHSNFILPILSNSSDINLRRLAERVILSKTVCPALTRILGKKEFFIEEIDGIFNSLKNTCKDRLKSNDFRGLRLTNDDIFPSAHAWAFRKGAPFLRHIDKYMFWFHESGLQKKWSEDLLSPPRDVEFDAEGESTVNKFSGQFVLFVVGVSLSSLCFITEIIVYFIIRRKKSE